MFDAIYERDGTRFVPNAIARGPWDPNAQHDGAPAAADFGNGISSVVDWTDGWLFINPDLTVYLHRYPVGEWVGLEALTHVSDSGIGLAEAALYDVAGRIGRSLQSLLLDQVE